MSGRFVSRRLCKDGRFNAVYGRWEKARGSARRRRVPRFITSDVSDSGVKGAKTTSLGDLSALKSPVPLAASYDLTYFWPTASISSDTRIQPTIRSARSSTDFLAWLWHADETLAATHATNGAAANAERLPHTQGLQLTGSVNPGKISRVVHTSGYQSGTYQNVRCAIHSYRDRRAPSSLWGPKRDHTTPGRYDSSSHHPPPLWLTSSPTFHAHRYRHPGHCNVTYTSQLGATGECHIHSFDRHTA